MMCCSVKAFDNCTVPVLVLLVLLLHLLLTFCPFFILPCHDPLLLISVIVRFVGCLYMFLRQVFECSDEASDDWYWMYAAVAFDDIPMTVISNDKTR